MRDKSNTITQVLCCGTQEYHISLENQLSIPLLLIFSLAPVLHSCSVSEQRASSKMEVAGRAMNLINRLINSNVFIDICLVGSFAALGLRSMYQEKLIESLESEKQTLTQTNKAMKKILWDWKQQLYADASSPDTAIVPLSRLKAIYGEVVSVPSAENVEKEGKTSAKIVI